MVKTRQQKKKILLKTDNTEDRQVKDQYPKKRKRKMVNNDVLKNSKKQKIEIISEKKSVEVSSSYNHNSSSISTIKSTNRKPKQKKLLLKPDSSKCKQVVDQVPKKRIRKIVSNDVHEKSKNQNRELNFEESDTIELKNIYSSTNSTADLEEDWENIVLNSALGLNPMECQVAEESTHPVGTDGNEGSPTTAHSWSPQEVSLYSSSRLLIPKLKLEANKGTSNLNEDLKRNEKVSEEKIPTNKVLKLIIKKCDDVNKEEERKNTIPIVTSSLIDTKQIKDKMTLIKSWVNNIANLKGEITLGRSSADGNVAHNNELTPGFSPVSEVEKGKTDVVRSPVSEQKNQSKGAINKLMNKEQSSVGISASHLPLNVLKLPKCTVSLQRLELMIMTDDDSKKKNIVQSPSKVLISSAPSSPIHFKSERRQNTVNKSSNREQSICGIREICRPKITKAQILQRHKSVKRPLVSKVNAKSIANIMNGSIEGESLVVKSDNKIVKKLPNNKIVITKTLTDVRIPQFSPSVIVNNNNHNQLEPEYSRQKHVCESKKEGSVFLVPQRIQDRVIAKRISLKKTGSPKVYESNRAHHSYGITNKNNDDDVCSVLSISASSDLVRDLENIEEDGHRTTSHRQDKFTYNDNNEEDDEEDQEPERQMDYDYQSRAANGSRPMNYEHRTRIVDWVSKHVEPTMSAWSSDFSDGQSLIGTAFDGYCLAYLRSSVKHQCQMKHEVPKILHQTEPNENGDYIANAIEKTIHEGFNNPPLQLLKYYIQFCVNTSKMTTLKRLGKALALNIKVDNDDGKLAKRFWECFIDEIVTTIKQKKTTDNKRNHQYRNYDDCSKELNEILKGIFVENNIIDHKHFQILKIILECLSTNYVEFRFLDSVQFLKDTNYPISQYPLNFKMANIKKVVSWSLNVGPLVNLQKGNKLFGFAYKVYKTLINGWDCVRELHQISPKVVEDFLEISQLQNPAASKMLLKIRNGNSCGSQGSSSGSFTERNQLYPEKAAGNNQSILLNTVRGIEKPRINDDLKEIITERDFNPEKLVRRLESATFNNITKKCIFEAFYDARDGYSRLLQTLRICPDFLKESLNDVTMTFMSLENKSMPGSWLRCYSLYKEMRNFNPRTIKNFHSVNGTPALSVFLAIEICLKVSELKDVVTLLTKCYHQLEWTVSSGEEASWKDILYDIKNALNNASHNSKMLDLHTVYRDLIVWQKSLEIPINVQDCLAEFLNNLLNDKETSIASELVSVVVQAGLLKSFMLQNPDHYRVLIVKMVRDEKLSHASLLMQKARLRVPCYPKDLNALTPELQIQTCLSSEEMKIAIQCKLNTSSELSSNLKITFQNCVKECHLLSEIRDLNQSIPSTSERFKLIFKKLYPNAGVMPKPNTTLIIDRITLLRS